MWGYSERPKLRPLFSRPFPQRESAADTNDYAQPAPRDGLYYQTYARGNMLPGLHVDARAGYNQWHRLSTQYTALPQLQGGALGPGMSSVRTSELLARFRALWGNN